MSRLGVTRRFGRTCRMSFVTWCRLSSIYIVVSFLRIARSQPEANVSLLVCVCVYNGTSTVGTPPQMYELFNRCAALTQLATSNTHAHTLHIYTCNGTLVHAHWDIEIFPVFPIINPFSTVRIRTVIRASFFPAEKRVSGTARVKCDGCCCCFCLRICICVLSIFVCV